MAKRKNAEDFAILYDALRDSMIIVYPDGTIEYSTTITGLFRGEWASHTIWNKSDELVSFIDDRVRKLLDVKR